VQLVNSRFLDHFGLERGDYARHSNFATPICPSLEPRSTMAATTLVVGLSALESA